MEQKQRISLNFAVTVSMRKRKRCATKLLKNVELAKLGTKVSNDAKMQKPLNPTYG